MVYNSYMVSQLEYTEESPPHRQLKGTRGVQLKNAGKILLSLKTLECVIPVERHWEDFTMYVRIYTYKYLLNWELKEILP